MSRLFVNQLVDGQGIDEIYLASEKQLRPNRQGSLYLQVRLSDKTGSITAMMWNASQKQFDGFNSGDYVRVLGNAQLYNGNMQVIAREIFPAEPSQVNDLDFITMSQAAIEQLTSRLADMLRSMENPHLRNLADCFLTDEAFMARFRKAPAGIKNHHAYHGGLIEHVVSLMELAQLVGKHYPRLNSDLLLMGAMLHDVGKIDELCYDPDLGYEDAGQLLGHMVMGVEILQERIRDVERQTSQPFPAELAVQLKHLVLSHHGQLEFGSPVLPMTLEAIALHFLDNLDARLHNVIQIIDEDVNPSSPWTTYQPALSRKIYKKNLTT
jgi:3'-5' exoribonuclease